MSVHVFLGPSLSVDDARRILPDAHYWPPAAMGDIHSLVEREQPSVIAIVDGLFERTPAVWHKEILYALSKGVRVHGASSMGALRAAELHSFGMAGHGRIFESFRDGELEDDDEVAVIHGPAEDGFRLLSDAMVNLRYGLDLAAREGCITPATRDVFLREAKSRYYADRSWPALFSRAAALTVPAEEVTCLREYVRRTRPDLKRKDALELLTFLRDAKEATPHVPSFTFEPTTFWTRLTREAAPSRAAPAGRNELRDHVCVSPRGEDTLRAALLLELLDAEARRRGTDSTPDEPEEIRKALDRLRRRHGLLSADAMRAWMDTNEVSTADLGAILRLEIAADAAQRRSRGSGALALELKRTGRHGETRRKLEAQRAARGEPIPLPEVIDWYQRHVRLVGDSLTGHAHELGFERVGQLTDEMTQQMRAAGHARHVAQERIDDRLDRSIG